jgi:nucleotide-binding universal stress UspA family protein
MFERIVVGVNQVDSAARAAREALALAVLTGGEVHLVCAIEGKEGQAPLSAMVPGAALAGGEPSAQLPGHGEARRHAEGFLAGIARDAPAGVRTHAHVLPGDAADVLLQVAGEVDADLIVVGSKGMKGARRVLGSVPNSVSHNAHCSVLIVRTV